MNLPDEILTFILSMIANMLIYDILIKQSFDMISIFIEYMPF